MSKCSKWIVLGVASATLAAASELGAQEAPRTFGRGTIGFGAGATASAVVIPAVLASACTGSGEYLQFCRATFVGGVALSGALGAIIGSTVRRDAPSGRALPVLMGSSIGAMIPFLGSVAACDQERHDNPAALCGFDGMVNPLVSVLGAVAGGIVGYQLGGRSSGLGVTHLGPVVAPSGVPAIGIGLRRQF